MGFPGLNNNFHFLSLASFSSISADASLLPSEADFYFEVFWEAETWTGYEMDGYLVYVLQN